VLKLVQVDSGYGKKQVLHGVSLAVNPGEIAALIGPNGAGKSTVLKVIHGVLSLWHGEILFGGVSLAKTSSGDCVRLGIGFCPQGNRVFTELTVRENLEVGGFMLPKDDLKTRISEMQRIFPVLKAREKDYAGKLSGGEQQLVAIARALIPQPKLLLLDEPCLGLSARLSTAVFEKIAEVCDQTGVAILIVEQKVREVLEICNRVYSLKLGKVVFDGHPDELKNDKAKLKQLFL
jgi:ABC-type branched-subunit amino acid transport system ATPase component